MTDTTPSYIVSAPQGLHVSIGLPASKSISNRVLVLHALAQGKAGIQNLSECDDTRVMTEAFNGLPTHIDIGAAGTAMRFLTAYLSVTEGTRTLTGTQRMRQRPIGLLVEALRSLGAQIEYVENEGFPPLRITGGKLQGNQVTLAGNVSSQYISALLMIGPMLPNGLHLHLTDHIISRPYIDLTLQLMKQFGAEAAWSTPDSIDIQPGTYRDIPFTVESDWSAASYWYEMLALTGDPTSSVELSGLFEHSHQGDSHGADLFARLGVQTTYTPQGVHLSKTDATVDYLDEDLTNIPDLAQTFVVTCCLRGIPFRFCGLQSLRIKETDRIAALVAELHKLGYVLRPETDGVLMWKGERCTPQPTPVIATYEDHRMAMAFAPACLTMPHLRIAHPEVVSKSYPGYWDDLRRAEFQITPDKP